MAIWSSIDIQDPGVFFFPSPILCFNTSASPLWTVGAGSSLCTFPVPPRCCFDQYICWLFDGLTDAVTKDREDSRENSKLRRAKSQSSENNSPRCDTCPPSAWLQMGAQHRCHAVFLLQIQASRLHQCFLLHRATPDHQYELWIHMVSRTHARGVCAIALVPDWSLTSYFAICVASSDPSLSVWYQRRIKPGFWGGGGCKGCIFGGGGKRGARLKRDVRRRAQWRQIFAEGRNLRGAIWEHISRTCCSNWVSAWGTESSSFALTSSTMRYGRVSVVRVLGCHDGEREFK